MLRKNKIKYHKLYTGRIDKEKICEDENADFFFDDDLKITANVAKHFAQHPHPCQALLATSEYNKDLPASEGVDRILDFKHFAEYLNNLNIFDNIEPEK